MWIHCRPSNYKFLSAAVVKRNKAFYQDISYLKGDYEKCEVLRNGHKLFFPFLENAISLSSCFQHKPGSQISFTPALTPGIHLHSSDTVPRINLSVQQGCSMPRRLLSHLHSHPIQTLTTGFCLIVPILSGSRSEFFPLQPWSALITLSIVLAVSGSSSTYFSPVPYSVCPCSLPK